MTKKKYDESMKKFVGAHPQDFIDWLCTGALFDAMMPTELKSRDIFVDALCLVTRADDDPFLAHVEFQKNIRADMPARLLEYNILARREHKLPVASCVIYLMDEGTIEESPLQWTADGNKVLDFYYTSIRLWEVDPEKFTRPGREGILPLVLLTTGNGNIEVLDMVIDALMATDKQELLPITEMLASLIFQEKPDELEKCKRRFAVLRDIMRETPGYQQIWQEGREEGIQEGREEGIQEGKLRESKEALIDFVQLHFPQIKRLVEPYVANITDLATIRDIRHKIYVANTAEEAIRLLCEVGQVDKKD